MLYDDLTISSIPELITAISRHAKTGTPVWYRGHSDKDYKLIPSLVRGNYSEVKNKEMNSLKRFKQDAHLLITQGLIPKELIEWLFVMRHHKASTRLLDWSENPLVAIFFAVCGPNNSDKDGAFWTFLPLEFNKQGGRQLEYPEDLPTFGENDDMEVYTPENMGREEKTKLPPIAFIAPRNTPRMQAQASVFTIHHRLPVAIEDFGDKNHIWRYIIPFSAKEQIKKELALLHIDKPRLFPELESLGETLM